MNLYLDCQKFLTFNDLQQHSSITNYIKSTFYHVYYYVLTLLLFYDLDILCCDVFCCLMTILFYFYCFVFIIIAIKQIWISLRYKSPVIHGSACNNDINCIHDKMIMFYCVFEQERVSFQNHGAFWIMSQLFVIFLEMIVWRKRPLF